MTRFEYKLCKNDFDKTSTPHSIFLLNIKDQTKRNLVLDDLTAEYGEFVEDAAWDGGGYHEIIITIPEQ